MGENCQRSKKTVEALKDLTMIFVIMITHDKKIEIRKNVLVEIPPSWDAYEIFKQYSKIDPLGYWTPQMFHKFIQEHSQLQTSPKELSQFLTSLNFDQPKLAYSDFLDMILPTYKNGKSKRLFLNRAMNGGEKLPSESKHFMSERPCQEAKNKTIDHTQKACFTICQVIDQELKLFRELLELRNVTRQKERSLHLLEAFSLIDERGHGGVGKREILKFLNLNVKGASYLPSDMTSLFKRLKLQQNRKVSYCDLLNALFPFNNKGGPIDTERDKISKTIVKQLEKRTKMFRKRVQDHKKNPLKCIATSEASIDNGDPSPNLQKANSVVNLQIDQQTYENDPCQNNQKLLSPIAEQANTKNLFQKTADATADEGVNSDHDLQLSADDDNWLDENNNTQGLSKYALYRNKKQGQKPAKTAKNPGSQQNQKPLLNRQTQAPSAVFMITEPSIVERDPKKSVFYTSPTILQVDKLPLSQTEQTEIEQQDTKLVQYPAESFFSAFNNNGAKQPPESTRIHHQNQSQPQVNLGSNLYSKSEACLSNNQQQVQSQSSRGVKSSDLDKNLLQKNSESTYKQGPKSSSNRNTNRNSNKNVNETHNIDNTNLMLYQPATPYTVTNKPIDEIEDDDINAMKSPPKITTYRDLNSQISSYLDTESEAAYSSLHDQQQRKLSYVESRADVISEYNTNSSFIHTNYNGHSQLPNPHPNTVNLYPQSSPLRPALSQNSSSSQMLSPLIEIIQKLKFAEESVHVARINLVQQCEQFNTRAAFHFYFSEHCTPEGRMSAHQLKLALNRQGGVALTNFEAAALVKRFDSNFDGLLSQTDLADIFTPVPSGAGLMQDEQARLLGNELVRRTFATEVAGNDLDAKSKEFAREVFQNLIESSARAQLLKDQLSAMASVTDLSEAFLWMAQGRGMTAVEFTKYLDLMQIHDVKPRICESKAQNIYAKINQIANKKIRLQ